MLIVVVIGGNFELIELDSCAYWAAATASGKGAAEGQEGLTSLVGRSRANFKAVKRVGLKRAERLERDSVVAA